MADRPRYLFVTGRLAEFALRQVLDDLAPQAGFTAEVAVLPISVAALMTPTWVARHLEVPAGIDRVILPGHCRGDLGPVLEKAAGIPVERGPRTSATCRATSARPIGRRPKATARTTSRSWPRSIMPLGSPIEDIDPPGRRFRDEGADVIDLGCDPGAPWDGRRRRRRALRDRRASAVSIDSFDPAEVADAVGGRGRAGPERERRPTASGPPTGASRSSRSPTSPGRSTGSTRRSSSSTVSGVPFRIDPILEPIGFGFAASLGRYLEVAPHGTPRPR